VLVLVQNLWETDPLEETTSREDAPEGVPQTTMRTKWSGRLAVTRTTVPGRNDKSRWSWRTTGGTVEVGVEPGCRGS
jgi:hypothetical protein